MQSWRRKDGGWSDFESPGLDGRTASVFWRGDANVSVLHVTAVAASGNVPTLSFADVRCERRVVQVQDRRQLVLFANDTRSLQLDIHGAPIDRTTRLLVDALVPAYRLRAHRQAVERLRDLVRYGMLRPPLYPPYPRGRRLTFVLRVLDGDLDGAAPAEIAAAIYSAARARRDWSDPSDNLRDHMRRAIRRGRFFMEGGYRQLLRYI